MIDYILDLKEAEAINKSIALWLNDKGISSPCSAACYVSFTFNIPWAPITCRVKMKIEEMNNDFMHWLSRFLDVNSIKFPYASTFFTLLIYDCLRDESITAKWNNTLDRIKRIKESICRILLNSGQDIDPNKDEFIDKLLAASPSDKEPLADFEGDIYFKAMESEEMRDLIIINGLT